MVFEQFVFRYVTTLPPMITQAEYGVYAIQAFAVVATFCMGILLVPSLTQSIFSGSSGESAMHEPRQRQRACSRGKEDVMARTTDQRTASPRSTSPASSDVSRLLAGAGLPDRQRAWPGARRRVGRLAPAGAHRAGRRADHAGDRWRRQSEDAREREAPVRRAVRLGAGAQHLPEDRAGARVPGGARAHRPEHPHGATSTPTSSRSSSASTRSAGPRRWPTTRPGMRRRRRSCATS